MEKGKREMKKAYLIWNLTNYDSGFEMLKAYPTKAKAQKAYKEEMIKRYGTTDEDELLDIWNDDEHGKCDSWTITEIKLGEK